MQKNIKKLLEKNEAIINGWLSIPNSFTAEAMSKMGWDTLTIDLQHGQNDYINSISMLQSISNGNALPMVRVPWNEPGIIMKMLDLGILGIIAPMINSKEECEKFISYCRYPPLGQRSFGPMRAQLVHGSDYPVPTTPFWAWFRGLICTDQWDALRHITNPIEADYQTKIAMGFPPEHFTRINNLLRKTV